PGRDRMAVHALWEIVLLLGVGAMGYLLRATEPAALGGTELKDLMLFAAEIGLVTVAMAASLRTSAPNLALRPLVYASALFFTGNSSRGLLPTAGVTGLIALGVGAVLVVLVVGFHVPGWAASLGVALALIVWIGQHSDPIDVVKGAYDP